MSDQHNLEIILKSHFPIIVVETHEERRAVELIRKVVLKTDKRLLTWTATQGLNDQLHTGTSSPSIEGWGLKDYDGPATNSTLEPDAMLESVRKSTNSSVIVLLDFHPYLTNPQILRLVKEIAQDCPMKNNTLVFISHKLDVPDEIKKLCVHFSLSLPDAKTLKKLVYEEARVWALKSRKKVSADKKALELLVRNLMGLTISDAKRLIKNAIYDDGAITLSDIPGVMKAKYELVSQEGILSFEYDTVAFSDVGGFRRLKDWLEKRKNHFLNFTDKTQIDIPRGILLLGIQGCGKSLAAKAIAGVWGIPLLRMDFGALYNKYIGETEKNIRLALKSAETLAPCVLWIDEIEKGLDTEKGDGGTSRRVLGTLLTWMAENKVRVFIVATANDIESLPPELIRKGRMDEIFFVDLPTVEIRREILCVHINKRDLNPTRFDLDAIANETDGFSGAELEQVIVSALYSAAAENQEVSTAHILSEIGQTQPLSVVMAENLQSLRQWASDRTVNVQ